MPNRAPVFMHREHKAWDHKGKTRQQRGYGRAHDRMRAHLMATVIVCEECRRNGRTSIGVIADHIKPLAQGGSSDRANYQLLCRPCSAGKSAAEAKDGRGGFNR